MVCFTRDDVLEDGVNVWYGEETPSFKPKFDLFLVHGLGSHPYYSWLHEPSPRLNRSSSAPGFCDSTVSLIPSGYKFLRLSPTAEDGPEHAALLSSPDLTWQNEYSATDFFGRIGTFWPRDLLQLDVPDVRISTVGYRSQWISSKFRTSFKECGEHLLKIITQARTSADAQSRPIIFIAHSFGGLVVQSALVSARIDERYSSISQLASGCLFLGCPFQGTSAVALLSMATTLSGNHQEILDSLRPGNPHLQTLQDQFSKGYPNLHIVCFFEKIKTGIGRTIMVVSENAACIPGAKRVGLEKDHVSMNKYRSSNDESYALLLAELKTMIKLQDRKRAAKRAIERLHQRNGGIIRTQVDRIVKKHIAKTPDPQRSERWRPEARTEQPPSALPAVGCTTIQFELDGTVPQSSSPDCTKVPTARAITPRVPMRESSLAFGSRPHTSTVVHKNDVRRQPKNADINAPSTLYAPMGYHAQWITAASDSIFMPCNLPPHLVKKYETLQIQANGSPEGQQTARMGFRQKHVPHNDSINGQIVELAASCTFEPASRIATSQQIQSSEMPHPSGQARSTHQRVRLVEGSSHAVFDGASCLHDGGDPLRYIKHVELEMDKSTGAVMLASRKSILDKIMPDEIAPMPNNRVALTGPLGIGKTYIAMACIWRLIQQFPNLPIFWVSAATDSQLQQDCEAITRLVGLKRPRSFIAPLDWIVDISRQLSKFLVGTWLLVLDGFHNSERERTLLTLLDSAAGKDGHIIITTRHIDIGKSFLGNRGLSISVGPLEPCYSADLLASDASSRHAGIFDMLAQSLEFDPFAVINVKAFLGMTRMPCADYVSQLALVLDQDNWGIDGVATKAARAITSNLHAEHTQAKPLPTPDSDLVPVMRSCINPSWFIIFDQLQAEQRAASELLGTLSALGRKIIPRALVHSFAAASRSVDILERQSFLIVDGTGLKANKLMLIAHRMWLVSRQELGRSFTTALRTVAYEYPDCSIDEHWEICEQMEAFAVAATSDAAKSWSGGDDTNRWCRIMLDHKREKFHRLGRRNALAALEMENSKNEELSSIFCRVDR